MLRSPLGPMQTQGMLGGRQGKPQSGRAAAAQARSREGSGPVRAGARALTELGLADVDQHVGVGAVPHGQVVVVAPVVVLDGFLLRAPGHHVVVKLTPL